ncbi:LPS export ABC transporter permease LptG [Vibrio sp. RC27]
MFKLLDWYIGRTIIATTSLVLVTFLGLSGIIKYVEQLRKVGQGSYDMLKAILYVLLSLPRDLEVFFPMAALLGALIGLGALASSSELVVMQASGFSKLDIGLSVLKTAIPLMIVIVLLGQWGAPQAQKYARDMRSISIYGGKLLSVNSGVWARDVDDFVFIGKVENDVLYAVNIWRFDEDKELKQMIFSEKVSYLGGSQWVMDRAKFTEFKDEVEIKKYDQASYVWHTSIEPDKLAAVSIKPEELSLSGLYDYVDYLKISEQDASRYELAFWRKISQPFSIAVMMLMALSFVFGPLRSVTMGTRVVTGVLSGFGFYISSELFGPMSMVYGFSPIFGAIAPSLVFLVLAIALLRRKL